MTFSLESCMGMTIYPHPSPLPLNPVPIPAQIASIPITVHYNLFSPLSPSPVIKYCQNLSKSQSTHMTKNTENATRWNRAKFS